VIADPVEWARRHGEPHWAQLVTEGPQGWADPEELLRQMDADGVECVLLQAWYWENPDTARLQNDWHAEWVARHPDRFLACAAIHPDLPDPVVVLKEAKGWGARAVGECLPQVQAKAGWRHPAWAEILATTTAEGWPLALHVTEPAGHLYPGRLETPLMELVALFERFSEQKWLCAHWGGGLPFYSLNRRVGQALRNVWFDAAAGPLLYDARIWRIACDLVGADKILFGSDFPLRLYPRLEKAPGWARLLGEFHEAGLSAAEARAIAGENFLRLIGHPDTGPRA
jgi:predicted TIM-barrel fold metal-dependent hydrolase